MSAVSLALAFCLFSSYVPALAKRTTGRNALVLVASQESDAQVTQGPKGSDHVLEDVPHDADTLPDLFPTQRFGVDVSEKENLQYIAEYKALKSVMLHTHQQAPVSTSGMELSREEATSSEKARPVCVTENCTSGCKKDYCAEKCTVRKCGLGCKGNFCARGCQAYKCGAGCKGQLCAGECVGESCGLECEGAKCAQKCNTKISAQERRIRSSLGSGGSGSKVPTECGRGCKGHLCAGGCVGESCGLECSGGAKYSHPDCARECVGKSCGSRCKGQNCAQGCKGENCGSGCEADYCAKGCIGNGCGKVCKGGACARECIGKFCGFGCKGDHCQDHAIHTIEQAEEKLKKIEARLVEARLAAMDAATGKHDEEVQREQEQLAQNLKMAIETPGILT